MLALLLAGVATSHAEEVAIEKKGMLPAYLFVDGEPRGKVTKSSPALTLPDGPHELWFTRDADGTYTACHGLVQASASVTVADTRCDGLRTGTAPETWSKGASLRVTGGPTTGAWVSVDGGRAITLLPAGLEANVAAGRHVVVVSTDPSGAEVVCRGQVTVDTASAIVVGEHRGCTGFDPK